MLTRGEDYQERIIEGQRKLEAAYDDIAKRRANPIPLGVASNIFAVTFKIYLKNKDFRKK